MIIRMVFRTLSVCALTVFVAQAVELPPPGIAISDADRKELQSGLQRLGEKMQPLKSNAHFGDVEVYHKAVRFALEENQFYKPDEVFHAKELLRTGNERAESLLKGDMPWLRATGLVIRGYRSKIDGSVQPYGLWIPPSFAPDRPHKWRLDLWLHGRSDTLSEVNFIWNTQRNPGEFTPRDTIVLFLYGRYCNANKFAGAVDLFEAVTDLKRDYNIDENRTLVRGFSMGGAGTWFIAAHFPDMFTAAAPGAGFAETAEYQHIYEKAKKDPTLQPTWWEEKLWKLTDDTVYAANFYQLPVVAYNGDQDPQRQAADIMARNMGEEGLTLSRVWGKDTGHKYHPDAKVEINRKLDALADRGRDAFPRKIRFTTWTLAYNQMRWITVDGLEKHWERARVEAEVENDHAIRAKTSNISALTLAIGPGSRLLDPAAKINVGLDGQSLTSNGPESDGSWTAHFRKNGGKWQILTESPNTSALTKHHGLQGPIDDAFMDSFLMVRPTGTPLNSAVAAWTKAEAERAIHGWKRLFRGDTPVKDDAAVTDEDIAAHNLILWGDPQSNSILKRIAGSLPIHWTAETVTVGAQHFSAATHVPIMIFPNPLNPKKYVVLNSGFTFRDRANATNSLQIAELPDYAVVDVGTPPNDRWPGKIADAGFFGEKWELLPNGGR